MYYWHIFLHIRSEYPVPASEHYDGVIIQSENVRSADFQGSKHNHMICLEDCQGRDTG
jgi:hypothetical protein